MGLPASQWAYVWKEAVEEAESSAAIRLHDDDPRHGFALAQRFDHPVRLPRKREPDRVLQLVDVDLDQPKDGSHHVVAAVLQPSLDLGSS